MSDGLTTQDGQWERAEMSMYGGEPSQRWFKRRDHSRANLVAYVPLSVESAISAPIEARAEAAEVAIRDAVALLDSRGIVDKRIDEWRALAAPITEAVTG